MKKRLLVEALLTFGVIYICNVRRKNKKSTSSELKYNL